MTPETLDRAVDAILAGDLTSSPSGEATAAASLMTMASQIPPSPGRADVRRAVLAAAAAPRRSWLRRGLVLAPVAASLAFSGIAVAARTALPGDALYQVRRGLQAVRVAVAIGDQSKAVALLDRAERDVADAERALSRSRESDARKALRVFAADMATARSEIARLDVAAALPLTQRADALQERADRAAAGAEDDDGSSDSDDDSGSDDSNSGSGSDDSNSGSGSDDSNSGSGSDDSNSGSGSDDSNSGSGSDDSNSGSGSDDSNSGSGSDDSSSGSGSDGDSRSGSGSDDDSGSNSGSGSSGSGSDDDSKSGSGSGSDD